MKINIKNINIKSICATLFISLFLSCNNGVIEDLQKKNIFSDFLIKIGHGFQDIFGFFGNAMGDALGFSAVKSGDKKSEVGKHFEKVKKGLEDTKNQLSTLSGKISEAKNADGSTIETVKVAIKGTIEVFDKLISSLTKLAGITNDGSTEIGASASSKSDAVNASDVKTVIEGVKDIIDAAEKSGVKIDPGKVGIQVANGNGPKSVFHNAQAADGDAKKLADEVGKADPWAMIDKIRNAKTDGFSASGDNSAGQLATGGSSSANSGTAATNADLAAAVALKAMAKGGKFTQPADSDAGAVVKGAAVSAVNKVLGILNVIIRKTVDIHLDKIGKAVKGIKYSETIGESTEVGIATK
ncbi:variable large family protein (plasmid) [Borrelia coriaceae]|uniref:Variable large protein n=1 Tax=Borrelia coriaceae ATCC 43381 TaxID=1408429 RepID=W5SXT2_9SPIR|nr:variable large family protein [Borrelia coriaceae]AHH11692.1 Variable major protein [Borrelia coriaceae ATCC 43381]UPA17181.1 variable large family protein [Borrelia coriaceae]